MSQQPTKQSGWSQAWDGIKNTLGDGWNSMTGSYTDLADTKLFDGKKDATSNDAFHLIDRLFAFIVGGDLMKWFEDTISWLKATPVERERMKTADDNSPPPPPSNIATPENAPHLRKSTPDNTTGQHNHQNHDHNVDNNAGKDKGLEAMSGNLLKKSWDAVASIAPIATKTSLAASLTVAAVENHEKLLDTFNPAAYGVNITEIINANENKNTAGAPEPTQNQNEQETTPATAPPPAGMGMGS